MVTPTRRFRSGAPGVCRSREARRTRHASGPPFPEGTSAAVFGLGCFWGAERKFWQIDGVYDGGGYAGASRRTRPTRRCAADVQDTPRPCSSSSTPKVSYRDLLAVFWEAHDPTQGMRQGNDKGTQYRSAIYYADDERAAAEETRDAYEQALGCRLRSDHHGDRARRSVLLCRGLPPAVPAQGPQRILRFGRDRRELPSDSA